MARAFLEPYENMFIELTLENYPDAVELKDERER